MIWLKKTLQKTGHQQFIAGGLNMEALHHGALHLWSDTHILFATVLIYVPPLSSKTDELKYQICEHLYE